MIIRQGNAADYPQLLDIWLRAVRATHHFLQPADIDALLPQLRDIYFPAVELWVAVDTALGFMFRNVVRVMALRRMPRDRVRATRYLPPHLTDAASNASDSLLRKLADPYTPTILSLI